MDLKELKRIIKVFQESGVSELEVETEGMRVRLKRGGEGEFSPPLSSGSPAPSVQEEVAEEKTNTVEIKSPMVGTFYRAPAPDSPSFVEEGQEIDVGDVVCIIEAMKLMNEIKSEVKGRVAKVLVENGQAVEFGQPLFLIELSE